MVTKMNDYCRGAWETINYSIRLLKTFDREKAVEQLRRLKEELEEGVAVDFVSKIEQL